MTRICLALLLALAPLTAASGTWVPWTWDNYLSPGNSDGVAAKSSERNTLVTNSWTGDDMVITASVRLQSISWMGLIEEVQGATYDTCDIIVFPRPAGFPTIPADPNAVIASAMANGAYFTNVPFARVLGGMQQGLRVIEGTVTLPTEKLLAPGEYYYAVRVVGTPGLGRHFVATTGGHLDPANPIINGQTMGVFQSSYFMYPDRPNWVTVDRVAPGRPTDYAYRLNGLVPEPASLMLLAVGAALFRWRR